MLSVKDLVKVYKTKGGTEVRALDGVTVDFPETGMVFLLGRSGSGKSTLLNVAGGLDKPDSGEVIVKGKSSKDFSGSDFDSYRNTFIGFVFQEYNILNEFNIEQNIALALQLQGKKNDKEAVNALLEQVDLAGMGKRKPNTLSGGQKQRVAIARALIKEPEIIMADEPTGALDSNTGKQVFDTLRKLSETKLVIIVSHDREFAEQYGDRIIELKDGKILTDSSKAYAAPSNVSENVNAIGSDTVRIKDCSKLTKAEFENIFNMLKGKDGEVIIASSESDIPAVKRACKITDDGSREYFKETTAENIQAKTYDGSQTKFIKSRLPIGHAIKMGASGLKTKPVRLLFTILISIISFTLFGVLLTMMMYNSVFSISEAIKKTGYTTALLQKTYEVERLEYKVDLDGNRKLDYSYKTDETDRISDAELAEMNKNSRNVKFAGVYASENYNYSYANYLGSSKENVGDGNTVTYPVSDFFGFTDCGEAFMTANGFNKIAGNYPTEANEIAVSEYVYNQFKDKGFRDSSTTVRINEPADLIGKELNIFDRGYGNSKALKIVGIYGVGDYLNKYEDVLKGTTTDKQSKDYQAKAAECEDEIRYGFHSIAFVSDGFYEEYKQMFGNGYSRYIQPRNMYGVRLSTQKDEWYNNAIYEYETASYYSETIVRNNAEEFNIYSLDGTKLNNSEFSVGVNDAYVSLSNLYDAAQRLAYSSNMYEQFYDADGNIVYNVYDGWTKEEKFWTNYEGDVAFEEKPGYGLIENGNYTYVHKNGLSGSYNDVYNMYDQRECYVDKHGNLTSEYPADRLLERKYEPYYTDGNGNYSDTECPEGWWNEYGEYYKDNVSGAIYIEISDIPEGYYLVDYNWYYVNVNDPTEIVEDRFDNWREVNGRYYLIDGELSSVKPAGYNNRDGFYVDPDTGKLTHEFKEGYEWHSSFYVDSEGNATLEYPQKECTELYGIFINENGDLSLTKKAGYTFRSQWLYNEDEGKVMFAKECNGYYVNEKGEKECDPAPEYTRPQYNSSRWVNYATINKEYGLAFARLAYATDRYYEGGEYPGELSGEDIALIVNSIIKDWEEWTKSEEGGLPDKLYARNRNNNEKELNIKGFYTTSDSGYSGTPILSTEFANSFMVAPSGDYYSWETEYKTDYVAPADLKYNYIIAKSDTLSEDIYFMLEGKDNAVEYRMYGNTIYTDARMAIEMIEMLSLIFLIVGLVMAVLSALMLFNFISTSISAKRKEIGVLRAVGARGTDVFKIFFAEAFIIAMICFVLSAVIAGVLCFVLNGIFASAINITVLNYGILEVLLILGVSVVVAVIATILPVYLAAKKPPVESIRAL